MWLSPAWVRIPVHNALLQTLKHLSFAKSVSRTRPFIRWCLNLHFFVSSSSHPLIFVSFVSRYVFQLSFTAENQLKTMFAWVFKCKTELKYVVNRETDKDERMWGWRNEEMKVQTSTMDGRVRGNGFANDNGFKVRNETSAAVSKHKVAAAYNFRSLKQDTYTQHVPVECWGCAGCSAPQRILRLMAPSNLRTLSTR